jgi:uncharacterized protein YjcR
MDKKLMLEQMVNYYTEGNKTKFAKMLGVKPQTINSWLLRNTFDAELIYSKCINISASWLLSGEGGMTESKTPSASNEELQEEIISLRAENNLLRELAGLNKKNGLNSSVG